jgi:hypothetical protein
VFLHPELGVTEVIVGVLIMVAITAVLDTAAPLQLDISA